MSDPQQSPQEDSKIHVDEDWKSQVQAEKEALQHDEHGQPTAEGTGQQIPDASFPMLVTTLATQATVALGQMGPPDAEEVPVDLEMAKHLIDTLAVLEEKTKGNLAPEESAMLTSVLHQLRMLYVAVKEQAKPATKKESSLELP
jgi:hypothetical protein